MAIPWPRHVSGFRPRDRQMEILALGVSRSGTECNTLLWFSGALSFIFHLSGGIDLGEANVMHSSQTSTRRTGVQTSVCSTDRELEVLMSRRANAN